MRATRTLGSAVLLLVCGACGRGTTATGGAAPRDSAGVVIVEDATPRLDSAHAWRLSKKPDLQIGGENATGGSALFRVTSAIRLDDGRIVVTDGGSQQLRFFDSTGAYLYAVGGKGTGPGEFDWIFGRVLCRSDSLLAYDYDNARLTFFDTDGKLLKIVQLSREDAAGGMALLGWLPDGSLLASGGKNAMYLGLGDGLHWDRGWILRIVADGSRPRRLLEYPSHETIVGGNGGASMGAWFLRGRQAVLAGSSIVLADNTDYELRYYDTTGVLRRVARRAYRPQAVTREEIDRFREHFRQSLAKGMLEGVVFPKTGPTFDRVLADRSGSIWVQEERPPGAHGPVAWSVFDGEGVWVTDVETPGSYRPMDIGDDYVLGVGRDSMDVERVQMYHLMKSSGAR